MKSRFSMSGRLMIGFGGSFIVLSFLSVLCLYLLLQNQLKAAVNLILEDRVRAVETLLKSPSHGLSELHHRIDDEWPVRGGEKVFLQILDADKNLVMESPHVNEKLRGAFESLKVESEIKKKQQTRIENDGVDSLYTGLAQQFDNSLGLKNPILVRVLVSHEQSMRFLGNFKDILAAVLIFNLVVSLLVGSQIVKYEVRPLHLFASKISEINSENLHERIKTTNLPSELVILADSFNKTLDRLENSFERLSQFSSDIAHELRTPISNMMGGIEVGLSRSRSSEEYCQLLESNLEECDRLKRITDSLLFLARANNLDHQFHLERTNIKTELEGLMDFYSPLAIEKNISLRLKETDQKEISILVDPTLFQRAIGNLIANAIKYTARGGQIVIQYFVDVGKGLNVSVSDTGKGISQEHLPHIFDRFYRVDPSRNIELGGTGLGLAIVKSIVEIHGGKISVDSEVGKGTTFNLSWPT